MSARAPPGCGRDPEGLAVVLKTRHLGHDVLPIPGQEMSEAVMDLPTFGAVEIVGEEA